MCVLETAFSNSIGNLHISKNVRFSVQVIWFYISSVAVCLPCTNEQPTPQRVFRVISDCIQRTSTSGHVQDVFWRTRTPTAHSVSSGHFLDATRNHFHFIDETSGQVQKVFWGWRKPMRWATELLAHKTPECSWSHVLKSGVILASTLTGFWIGITSDTRASLPEESKFLDCQEEKWHFLAMKTINLPVNVSFSFS